MVTDTYWTVYTVTSSGTLTGAAGQGCCADHSAIHLKLEPPCHVILEKVDDVNDCVGLGEDIKYTIYYSYRGDTNCPDVNDVNIIDFLPAEVEYVWSEPEPNEILDCNKIIWEIGTLKPGDANYITLKVRVKCVEPGSTITITNCCEIRSGNDVNEVLDRACENTPVCEPNYNYLVVDDFESYNNNYPNRIFDTWKAVGGALPKVGYTDINYAEVMIGLTPNSRLHGGRQAMPFDYNNLNSPYDSNATRTFATDQNWVAYKADPNHIYPLKSLSLWLRGNMAPVGSFDVNTVAGTYTMKAAGENFNVQNWRKPSTYRDEFRYAYIQVLYGCDIIARVDSLTATGSAQSRAGVMIRDSLDDNSGYGMINIWSGALGIQFEYRPVAGQTIRNSVTVAQDFAPTWLWLRREWNYSYYDWACYYSNKKYPKLIREDWNDVVLAGDFLEGSTADPIYIGLAVTSRNAAESCTAVFSNVSITDGGYDEMWGTYTRGPNPVPLTWPWPNADIGIKSNTAAPLYVTLQDSNNIAATVNHPDPNIVLTTTWQPWDIDLRDFNGVDLTKVKKMTIGVADSNGTGTLYFDDIRLYPPRCFSELRPTADFTCDCVVDYRDLKIMTDEWLSTRCHRTDLYKEDPNIVNFKDFAILAEQWLEEKLWPDW
jgi:hypothetical protein